MHGLPGRGAEAAVRALHTLAFCLLVLGYPERALRCAGDGAAVAAARGFERSLAVALRATAAVAATTLGRLDRADELLRDVPRPALRRFGHVWQLERRGVFIGVWEVVGRWKRRGGRAQFWPVGVAAGGSPKKKSTEPA